MKRKAVLIVNLGTPDAPTSEKVKEYLSVFLSDKRVINKPDIVWKPILNGIILKKRPPKVAKEYEKIWTSEGSPLRVYTQAQRKNLADILGDEYTVAFAMSYSHPRVAETIEQLLKLGIESLTVVPLYPQYSGTTVGSIYDDVSGVFTKTEKIIDIRFISRFYKHPLYVSYYNKKIKNQIAKKDVDAILFSYHNIPQEYADNGDPYPKECEETTHLIMNGIDKPFFTAYQSIFGKDPWMKPQTDITIKELPTKGIKKLLVVAPGFVSDCLETLIELDVENREYFLEAGGSEFTYLPAFNNDIEIANIIADIVKNN
ncbi:MAG: ferrochelatase [Defluviitaleaceae bacterium]|nr:ferrochelatase [Defluviitaleaceae bacterium]